MYAFQCLAVVAVIVLVSGTETLRADESPEIPKQHRNLVTTVAEAKYVLVRELEDGKFALIIFPANESATHREAYGKYRALSYQWSELRSKFDPRDTGRPSASVQENKVVLSADEQKRAEEQSAEINKQMRAISQTHALYSSYTAFDVVEYGDDYLELKPTTPVPDAEVRNFYQFNNHRIADVERLFIPSGQIRRVDLRKVLLPKP